MRKFESFNTRVYSGLLSQKIEFGERNRKFKTDLLFIIETWAKVNCSLLNIQYSVTNFLFYIIYRRVESTKE